MRRIFFTALLTAVFVVTGLVAYDFWRKESSPERIAELNAEYSRNLESAIKEHLTRNNADGAPKDDCMASDATAPQVYGRPGALTSCVGEVLTVTGQPYGQGIELLSAYNRHASQMVIMEWHDGTYVGATISNFR